MSLIFDALNQGGARGAVAPLHTAAVGASTVEPTVQAARSRPRARLWLIPAITLTVGGLAIWAYGFGSPNLAHPPQPAVVLAESGTTGAATTQPDQAEKLVEPAAVPALATARADQPDPAGSSEPRPLLAVEERPKAPSSDAALPLPQRSASGVAAAKPAVLAPAPAVSAGGSVVALPARVAPVVSPVASPAASRATTPEEAQVDAAVPAARPSRPSVAGRSMEDQIQVESRPLDLDVGAVFRQFMRHMQMKQYAEARVAANRVTQAMGAQHVMSLRVQGYLALAQNELASAMEQYLQLQASFPDDREAGFNLAVIDWRLGNKVSAIRRAQVLMQKHPDDIEVRTFYFSIRSS